MAANVRRTVVINRFETYRYCLITAAWYYRLGR